MTQEADPQLLSQAVLDLLAPHATVTSLEAVPITTGTGAASGAVEHLKAELHVSGQGDQLVSLVRKRLRPLEAGRHRQGARDPRHWAYWRREAKAYTSGLLPTGPGLRAPRCFGVIDDTLYLEAIDAPPARAEDAAAHLAAWQIDYDADLDRPWLSRDQLARRLEVSALDWSRVDADRRAVELWERRQGLCERLQGLPVVRSHGDYSLGNLLAHRGDTVVLDWATFGWEPIGFDLAHLALSCGQDPCPAYSSALSEARQRAVRAGFQASLALVGSSRLHWMLSRGHQPPGWYVDFLWEHRPA